MKNLIIKLFIAFILLSFVFAMAASSYYVSRHWDMLPWAIKYDPDSEIQKQTTSRAR